MKKLKYSKKMINETQSFVKLIENYCNKINKEYSKNVMTLLKKIADGENLDLEKLKKKYLSSPQIVEDIESNNILTETSTEELTLVPSDEEVILDKIIIDNNNFYYENKENGKVYNESLKIIGQYKNKELIFHEK